jgi:hypothetical protein
MPPDTISYWLERHRSPGELSSTWFSHRQPWAKSAYPLDKTDPNQGKKRKKTLNNKQQQKRHVAKKAECPHRTVNKQASQRRQEWQHRPATLERKVCKSGCVRKAPLERREGALPT